MTFEELMGIADKIEEARNNKILKYGISTIEEEFEETDKRMSTTAECVKKRKEGIFPYTLITGSPLEIYLKIMGSDLDMDPNEIP